MDVDIDKVADDSSKICNWLKEVGFTPTYIVGVGLTGMVASVLIATSNKSRDIACDVRFLSSSDSGTVITNSVDKILLPVHLFKENAVFIYDNISYLDPSVSNPTGVTMPQFVKSRVSKDYGKYIKHVALLYDYEHSDTSIDFAANLTTIKFDKYKLKV